MDVEGSDQRETPKSGHARRELRDRPPGPEPSTHVSLAVPQDWPEAVTWTAGFRLALAEEDTVPQLLRLGGDVTAWLDQEELAAQLELGPKAWERWLRLGWRAWELDQEEG